MQKDELRLKRCIEAIKAKLVGLGPMRPGALSKQYNVCGSPGCRCKDPRDPKKHGPYYQLSYSHTGKSTTEFVRKDHVREVTLQLKTYQVFRKLIDEWVDLSVQLAKAQRDRSTST